MKHIINRSNLQGQYDAVIASSVSNKGIKKLVISTIITDADYYITFDVIINGSTFPFDDIDSAIKYYNEQSF